MSKILIVEDEEAIADLEKDYLELSGFEVEIASDGTLELCCFLYQKSCRSCVKSQLILYYILKLFHVRFSFYLIKFIAVSRTASGRLSL